RVHVPDEELDAVAFDQLARLLHAGADVVGRILDQELNLAAEHAALDADQLVLRHRGIDPGERIDHADLDRVGGARRPDEGRGDLSETDDGAGLDDGAAVYGAEVEAFGHLFLPGGCFSIGDLDSAASRRQGPAAVRGARTHSTASPYSAAAGVSTGKKSSQTRRSWASAPSSGGTTSRPPSRLSRPNRSSFSTASSASKSRSTLKVLRSHASMRPSSSSAVGGEAATCRK